VEVEPGHTGQRNEDVTDVGSSAVGKQESDTSAAARHRRHAAAFRQQEGWHLSPFSVNTVQDSS